MPALKEEMRKKDEELFASVERLSALERVLKRKEEDLDPRKGVEAQCRDLQSRVDQLQGQLNDFQFEMDGLRGEVPGK